MASTPLIFAQLAGSPLKIVAAFDTVLAVDGRGGMGAIVRADSPIRTVPLLEAGQADALVVSPPYRA